MSQRFTSFFHTAISFLRTHLYLPAFLLIAAAAVLFCKHTGVILPANTTVGNRELPIYSVDTTEKKVALSFDAAWAKGSMMEQESQHKKIPSIVKHYIR